MRHYRTGRFAGWALVTGCILAWVTALGAADDRNNSQAASTPADAPAAKSEAAKPDGPLKIVAGPMFTPDSPNTITMWIQTNRPGDLRGEAMPLDPAKGNAPYEPGKQVGTLTTLAADHHVGVMRFMYVPGRRYTVSVFAGQEKTPLVTTEYGAPPRPGQPGKYRLMYGSCSNQEKRKKQPIWKVVAAHKPDLFLFIGDNMYLPMTEAQFPKTREGVRALYRDTYDSERRKPEMQPVLRTTMSYALWDDHDFGPNNSDRTWKWADIALESLLHYFPNNYGLPDTPGCFHRFAWGDIDVFMLDDRTYRDPNDDPKRKTFLGEKQLAWLKEGLAASKATFKLVVCGNEILAEGHPHESWGTQFKPERDAFLDWIWDKKLTGVIFLSGDRHFAELTRMRDPQGRGPDLWDLTSSPLANDPFLAGPELKNAGRVASYAWGANVGELEFDTTASPPRVTLRVLDKKDKVVIEQVVTTTK